MYMVRDVLSSMSDVMSVIRVALYQKRTMKESEDEKTSLNDGKEV